jgi:translocator protein
MEQYTWYASLSKPSWAPPAWLFGSVWSVLYVIIFISFGYVFYKVINKELSFWVGLPFLLNVVFNAAFTPLQFSLRSNTLALVDILLVLITLIWALYVIWPHFRWIALVNLPYLAWVAFATVLQATITYLNWQN